MNNRSEVAKKAIIKWRRENEVGLTDTHFYTREEWKARGEEYLNYSLLSITTEGDLYSVLSCEFGHALRDSFEKMLDDLGFMKEMAYSWMVGIYENN